MNGRDDRYSYSYTYNNDHLITSITRIVRQAQIINGTSQTTSDTSYNTFEYTNGLCSKATERFRSYNIYYTYEYNSNHLLIKRTLVKVDTQVKLYTFYKYDSLNNLMERRDSSDIPNGLIYKSEFTYNSNNNLTQQMDSTLFLTPVQVSKTVWSVFDDKVNYLKAINGLPPFFTVGSSITLDYTSANNNNPLTTINHAAAAGQPFDEGHVINDMIEYNEENLPSKITSGGWIQTFEYEKYK